VAEAVAQWSARLGSDIPVLATSAATGFGLTELAGELFRLVAATSAAGVGAGAGVPGLADLPTGVVGQPPGEAGSSSEGGEQLAEHMLFRPVAKDGFSVEQTGPGAYAVRGRRIERLLQRFDVENEDAMAYVEARLRRLGVIQALEAKGFQPGDEIEIGGTVLELDPSG
jgi:GTP-binding protein